jgi:hypothetical protein
MINMSKPKGKGIVDEIDNLEDIKKDNWELEKENEAKKQNRLKKNKTAEDKIKSEIDVFEYDEM